MDLQSDLGEDDRTPVWTEDQLKILKDFHQAYPNIVERSSESTDPKAEMLELMTDLGYTFLEDDIITKLQEIIASTSENKEWTTEEDEKFKFFCKEHPTISKNDARSLSTRNKLWAELKLILNNKFTVEDLHLKLIDDSNKWRASDVDTVIIFFEKRPYLWDAALTEYRNRISRNVALEELARKINFRKTAQEIITKFENLKTTFLDKCKKGHTGDEGKSVKAWPYFQSLLFLKKTSMQRPSFSNAANQISEPSNSITLQQEQGERSDKISQSKSSEYDDESISPGVTPPSLSKHKRKHRGSSDPQDDELKKKLLGCLDSKQTAAEAFGTNVAETLKKFTDVNQEMVKVQIQNVLAQSLGFQERNEPMPMFNFK